MRLPLLVLTFALAGLSAASAQPAGGGHEHAPHSGAPQPWVQQGEESDEGPNLRIPPWIGGQVKTDLEEGIAAFKAAFAAVRRQGQRAVPQVEAAIEQLEGVRSPSLRCTLPDYYLGIAYQLTGDNEQAVERLEAATELNPRFHEALVELGDAYRWAERPDDAAEAYDQAIEVAPDYAHAYYMRAHYRVAEGDLDEAHEDIERCLELAPDNPAAQALARQLRLVVEGPEWEEKFEAETRNYVVRTNVSQEFADDLAEQAELIRRLYTGIFPRVSRSRRKFPIVVFATREEYHQNGGPQGAGGHFDPTFKQLFLFQYEERSDTLLVLFHEGFHQFLDSVLDIKPPQWFNEGLADFFGPSEYYRDRRREGMRIRTNPWRLQRVKNMVRRGQDVPFETLMCMSQQEMYQRNAVGNHYAQAWAMIHFFWGADDGAYQGYLKDYFDALRDGKDRHEAYEEAFGRADMDAMQERFRSYVSDLQAD